MPAKNRASRPGLPRAGLLAFLAVVGMLAALVLSGGKELGGNMDRKPGIIGNDRLVFWQPLPATDGEMCQWVPASAAKPLAASLQQVPGASSATAAEEPRLREAARAEVRRRRPLRVIKDAHPGYAGVAVDPVRDEVVLTDENHFRLLVYDRMENTSV